MTKNETIVGIVAVVILAAFLTVVLWLRPYIHYSVEYELAGPRDEAMELLLNEEPLEEIQSAVRRSGKHVDQISDLGRTLLFHAVHKRRIDVARWLLKQGANPDGTWDGLGGIPLIAAIWKQDASIVRLLLAAGANPNGMGDGYGGVPLAAAIGEQDVSIVRLLLAGGADPDLEMCDGVTSPRKYAEELGNREVLAALPPERSAATRPTTKPATGSAQLPQPRM